MPLYRVRTHCSIACLEKQLHRRFGGDLALPGLSRLAQAALLRAKNVGDLWRQQGMPATGLLIGCFSHAHKDFLALLQP